MVSSCTREIKKNRIGIYTQYILLYGGHSLYGVSIMVHIGM